MIPIPYHRYATLAPFTLAGSQILLGVEQFQPAYFVIEGLDAVNNPVTEGSSCTVLLQNSGPGGSSGDIFQAIVYATSQGSFSWRGNMVVFPNQSVSAVVGSGAWSIFLWGHVEPPFSLSP